MQDTSLAALTMAKRLYYSDIIISRPISKEGAWIKWEVVDIEKNVEDKRATSIVKVLKRVLPPKYYVASIGPGQFEKGSTWSSK